ncbi:acyl-CoA dehydrogenase [Thalassiella azotivora]
MTTDRAAEAGLRTALRRHLDGRWADVRDDVRRRAEGTTLPDPTADQATYRAQVRDGVHQLAATGRPRLGFSTAHGGQGDVGGSVVSFEMLGFADLSLVVLSGVHWGLFGGALQALGTDRHHDRLLEQVMDAEVLGCFAMTETGHGSDVQSLGTTATYDPSTGEFDLHTPDDLSRKDYIGGAAQNATWAVVFAQLVTAGPGEEPRSHGVHALLVRLRDDDGTEREGITITDCGPKAGLNGVDNGRIAFDHVRLPREALLNRYGDVAPDGSYSSPIRSETRRFFTMLGTLVRGRISVAGSAGSATKKALTIAVRYGTVRRQFRQPGAADEVVVLDYLAHQRRLLPALARTYALHFAQCDLVETLHEVHGAGEPDDVAQRELETRAAGVKALATWHASRTIQTCREACGGAGYLSENQLDRLRADTDVYTTFEGDNTVLLQLVAKSLLTAYRDHVGDLDTLGMVRFVADQVVETAVERTAVRGLIGRLRRVRGGTHAGMLDADWHLELLTDREEHVLGSVARRLRRAAGAQGAEAFDLFNAAQAHMVEAARCHVERVLLEAFTAAVRACPDARARDLLEKVRALHALSEVEEHRAWFLEHGRITPAQSKQVTTAVDRLCGELRPHALDLVEAFGVPEPWLTAPIATGRQPGTEPLADL